MIVHLRMVMHRIAQLNTQLDPINHQIAHPHFETLPYSLRANPPQSRDRCYRVGPVKYPNNLLIPLHIVQDPDIPRQRVLYILLLFDTLPGSHYLRQISYKRRV